MESSLSKCQRFNVHDNKERQGLDEYESKGESKKYIFFPFIAPLLPSQRQSNYLTDLDKGTKSLNYFVYILKICYSEKC